jgi:hypothetical protein
MKFEAHTWIQSRPQIKSKNIWRQYITRGITGLLEFSVVSYFKEKTPEDTGSCC